MDIPDEPTVTFTLTSKQAHELEQLLLDVLYDPTVQLPGYQDKELLFDVLTAVETVNVHSRT